MPPSILTRRKDFIDKDEEARKSPNRVLYFRRNADYDRLIEACVDECVAGGHMREVNAYLLAYQLVAFAHAWALKQWSVGRRYALAEYVAEGIKLLVEPFLTAKGRRALEAMRARTDAFGSLGRKARRRAPAGGKRTK